MPEPPQLVFLDLDETLLPTSILAKTRHSGVPQTLNSVPGYSALALHDGLFNAIMDLKALVPIGIISSSPRWYVEQILERHLPGVDFCTIITYDDVEELKPSPEPLLMALLQIDAKVSEAAYVGDALVDQEACEAIGMRFIAAGWSKGDTFPDGTDVVNHPSDLARTLGLIE